MTHRIAVIGTLDTKGTECRFLAQMIAARGCEPFLIDVGIMDASPTAPAPQISAAEVARAAGADLLALRHQGDRGQAVSAMARGLGVLLPRLQGEAGIAGVIGLGGSGGTSIGCSGMRALPLGLPKVMVSTIAGTDVSGYVGASDIAMVPSIVDVAGLNRISRGVLLRAAAAVCAMAEAKAPAAEDRPLVAASMFGNTTPAVDTARAVLEKKGYEVLVFHATGLGGRTLEGLVDAGTIAGVLDLTTTEWADELVGGVLTAGPTRLEAAARRGVPAVVVPGCLDMVNFWAPETVPAKFAGRRLYPHNPNVTLMRTNVEESARLGEILAEKLNASRGRVTVLLPLRGLSLIGAPGGPFEWPEADQALFVALKAGLRKNIPVVELDLAINEPAFAERCAQALLENMGGVTAAVTA